MTLLLFLLFFSPLGVLAQQEQYFTVVMFSDVHVDERREGLTQNEFQQFVDKVIKMGRPGGKQFRFNNVPEGFVPRADLVLFLGDMDKDSQSATGRANAYQAATAAFDRAGIPFLDILGNHDLVPDYWSGANGTPGLSGGLTGGLKCNDVAMGIVTDHLLQAQRHGVTDVTRFTDGTTLTQAQPYAFLFRGVRFYMGQTYWFQKPYSANSLLGIYTGGARYFAPDGILNALDAYVAAHASEPSIWAQHYPFVFGSDCNRWWLDQNDVGRSILPQDNATSLFPATTSIYTSPEGRLRAKQRKEALASIICRTKNAVHFSGHVHEYAQNTYNGLVDYTLPSVARHKGEALIVLCHKDMGFVECQRVKLI